MDYASRVNAVRSSFPAEIDGLHLYIYDVFDENPKANFRYLTGFSGSTGDLLLTRDKALVFFDSRYTIEALKTVSNIYELRPVSDNSREITHAIAELGIKRLGVIGATTTLDRAEFLKYNGVQVKRLADIVRVLRAIKSPQEIELIRRAVASTEAGLLSTYEQIHYGMTEQEIARVFEKSLPLGSRLAFPSIVISGENTALPHGQPGTRKVYAGDIIQFDVGAHIDGYAADVSRVVVIGKPNQLQKRMYRAVKAAMEEAAQHYRIGVSTLQPILCADKVLRRRKFPKIPHGLGHGLGMETHEFPFLHMGVNDNIFRAGNVVTNEPGIYIKGVGGMRIEEDILVTENGPEFLTKLTNELIEL